MLDLGYWHPVIVVFVVAWLVTGVLLRALSFTGRVAWASYAATVLLIAGALLAFLALESGEAASQTVERLPWAVDAVHQHEAAGKWAAWVFMAVGALEAGLAFLRRRSRERQVAIGSLVLGVFGLSVILMAAYRGGAVVFSYGGGVGTRTGDTADRGRAFLSAAFGVVEADRRDGRPGDAVRLLEEMVRRYPGDLGLQLLVAESKLVDLKDAGAALEVLGRISIPKEEPALRQRHGLLLVDALLKKGQRGAAAAALQSLRTEFPNSQEVRDRMPAAGLP
jgi:uncharacterized membrane protein